jgi:Flp pilus assembly protein TadD
MNKQPDLARQQFEKAAQQQSSRSYAMARLGQIYEAAGDFVNARLSYEKALSADPDNVVAKNNLAWLYAEHGGNLDVALKLAEEAKEKAPDDPTITDTLGWIYVKKGSYEAAVANLKISVAKNPHDPGGLYHLGTAYYKLGRTADAKRELEAALRMPNFSQAADAKRMLAEMPGK